MRKLFREEKPEYNKTTRDRNADLTGCSLYICMLGNYPPRMGGPSTTNYNITKLLANCGCKIHVISMHPFKRFLLPKSYLKTDNKRPYQESKIKVTWISQNYVLNNISSLFFLVKEKYDVTQAYHPLTGFIVSFFKNIIHAKYVQYVLGDVWEQCNPRESIWGERLRGLSGHKLISRLALMTINFALKNADIIIVNGNDLKRKILRQGFKHNAIHVLHCPIDITIFRPYEVEMARNMVLCHSLLNYVNGIDILIEAIKIVKKEIPNVKLVLVGSGPQEIRLKHLVNTSGLNDSTMFTGGVAYERLPPYLNEATVCVYPLRFCGGVSQVIQEAMACGKPVITTKVGDNESVVRNGENGFIVEENAPLEIANLIIRLLKDKKLRERISRNARKTIVEKYSFREYRLKYVKLLNELQK